MNKTFLFQLFFVLALPIIIASPTYDHDLGTWTEIFNDTNGLSSNTGVNADVSDQTLKLTNASGGFDPPYNTSSYAITVSIIPISVVEWSNITFDSVIPSDTSINIQLMDEGNNIYSNSTLPGNSEGFTTSPINITGLQVDLTALPNSAKFGRLRIKINLTTSNNSLTPQIDNFTLSWVVRQGDFNQSKLANTSWPINNVDSKGTRHTINYLDPIYPVISWVKDEGTDYGGLVTRGTGDIIYQKTMGGVTPESEVTNGKLMAINRSNGDTIWERIISGYSYSEIMHTLSEDGTLYIAEMYNDMLLAYNSSDGSLKWTYQFNGGHGNDYVAIGDDGNIYTTRNNGDFTIYAFYPNGSIIWTNTTNPPDSVATSPTFLGENGTLYLATLTSNDGLHSGNGNLYAFNTSDGTNIWSYTTGDLTKNNLILDSDETIYVAQYSNNNSIEKSMFAIYPNGSLKWNRSIGISDDSWYTLSLRSDGVLLAERANSAFSNIAIEAVNTTDGAFLWVSENFSAMTASELFSDALNGFYFTVSPLDYNTLLNTNTSIYYYDINYNLRWILYRDGSYCFGYLMQDENGKIYGNVYKYIDLSSQNNTLFALSPWTLSVSSDPSNDSFSPSVDVNFSVSTSMQQTNLISGDYNQIQIVFDNGDKINLSYDSANGTDTIWTGNYNIPSNTTSGIHNFTVEANAAGIQTDIPTSFDSPATDSNNSGVNLIVEFNINENVNSQVENTGGSKTRFASGIDETEKIHLPTGGKEGETKTIKFSKDISITEVDLTLQNSVNQISLTIEKLTSKPTETTIPSGTTYSYLRIEGNLKDQDVKNAKIKFKVEKNWLASKVFLADEIVLKRYDKSWHTLPTKQLKSDKDYVYYESESKGFSYFAITAEKKVEPKAEPSEEKKEETKKQQQKTTQETQNGKTLQKSKTFFLIPLLIIIAISITILLIKKKLF